MTDEEINEIVDSINIIHPPDDYIAFSYAKHNSEEIDTDTLVAQGYDDYDIKQNESVPNNVIYEDSDIKISTLQNVYDNENHGLYVIETPQWEVEFHIDSIDELGKEKIPAEAIEAVKQYEEKNPRHELEFRTNIVTNEGKSTGRLTANNEVAISVSIVDKTEEKRLGLKNIDKIAATNPTQSNNTKNVIDAYKDLGLIAEQKILVKIPQDKLTDVNYVENGEVKKIPYKAYETAVNNLKETLKAEIVEAKMDEFERNASLKSLVNTAEAKGFLTQEDRNNIITHEIKDPKAVDLVKADIAISRLSSMPLVLDAVKDGLATKIAQSGDKGIEERYKAIDERIGNINKIINTLESSTPLDTINDLMKDMSKISNFVKNDIPDHKNISATGIAINNEKGYILVTNEALSNISKNQIVSKIPTILSGNVTSYIVDNGKLVNFDMEKPVFASAGGGIEVMRTSADTRSNIQTVTLKGLSREEIDRIKNELSQDNVEKPQTVKEEVPRVTQDDKQDKQQESRQDNQHTTRDESKNESKRDRNTAKEKDDDDLEYNPETGQYEKRDTKITPGKLALMGGIVAMAPLAMFFGPIAAAIMVPSLIGAGLIGGAVKYVREKGEKEDKDVENKKVENEAPVKEEFKEKGPSLMERLSEKIHSFGEKMENTREGKFQERVDNGGMKTGIDSRDYSSNLTKDYLANSHPVIEKISEGLHKMTAGNVFGKIFDKLTSPITKVSTDNVDSYLSRSNIRAKDELKDSIGLKGESLGSAFEKIRALAGSIGKEVGSVKTDLGEGNVSTLKEDNQKLGIGGFLKSAFAIIGKISLGTIIAESKLDYNGKIDKREYTDSDKLLNAYKDLADNKIKMESVEKERSGLIEKGENTEKIDSKLSDIYKEREDILNKALESSIPEVAKNNLIGEKLTINDKIKELGNERIEQVSQNFPFPDKESASKALQIEQEVKEADKKASLVKGAEVKAILAGNIEIIKKSSNGEDKENNIEKVKHFIGTSLRLYDTKIENTKIEIERESNNNKVKELKEELKDIEKNKADILKIAISESDTLNLSDDEVKKYEQELEKIEGDKQQEDNPVNDEGKNDDQQTKVEEEPKNNTEEQSTEDEKKGTNAVAAASLEREEQDTDIKEKDENEEAEVVKKETEEETIQDATTEKKEDDASESLTGQEDSLKEEQTTEEGEATVSAKTEDSSPDNVITDSSGDNKKEPSDESANATPVNEEVVAKTADETVSEEEPVQAESIELPDIHDPDEIKEFANQVENNEFNPDDLGQAIADNYKDSDNPKNDLIDFANVLKEEGVSPSNIQDVIDKAMEKMDLPEADKKDVDAKIEAPKNNDKIEETANEAASSCSTIVDAVADFCSAVFNTIEDKIENVLSGVADAIVGAEGKAAEEIANDNNILAETVDPAFNKIEADTEQNNVDQGVETQATPAEEVADYSCKGDDNVSQNEYQEPVTYEPPQDDSSNNVENPPGDETVHDNIDHSYKDF